MSGTKKLFFALALAFCCVPLARAAHYTNSTPYAIAYHLTISVFGVPYSGNHVSLFSGSSSSENANESDYIVESAIIYPNANDWLGTSREATSQEISNLNTFGQLTPPPTPTPTPTPTPVDPASDLDAFVYTVADVQAWPGATTKVRVTFSDGQVKWSDSTGTLNLSGDFAGLSYVSDLVAFETVDGKQIAVAAARIDDGTMPSYNSSNSTSVHPNDVAKIPTYERDTVGCSVSSNGTSSPIYQYTASGSSVPSNNGSVILSTEPGSIASRPVSFVVGTANGSGAGGSFMPVIVQNDPGATQASVDLTDVKNLLREGNVDRKSSNDLLGQLVKQGEPKASPSPSPLPSDGYTAQAAVSLAMSIVGDIPDFDSVDKHITATAPTIPSSDGFWHLHILNRTLWFDPRTSEHTSWMGPALKALLAAIIAFFFVNWTYLWAHKMLDSLLQVQAGISLGVGGDAWWIALAVGLSRAIGGIFIVFILSFFTTSAAYVDIMGHGNAGSILLGTAGNSGGLVSNISASITSFANSSAAGGAAWGLIEWMVPLLTIISAAVNYLSLQVMGVCFLYLYGTFKQLFPK